MRKSQICEDNSSNVFDITKYFTFLQTFLLD